MVSLCILVFGTLVGLALTGIVIALAARALGSPRGRIGVGISVAGSIFFIAIIVEIVVTRFPPKENHLNGLICLFLAVGELVVLFAIPKWAFRLSVGRAFGLLGVYLACGVFQFCIAIFVIKPHVIEAFYVPTASMRPTIDPGDRFVVNKLLSPRRWDIVAFRFVEDGSTVIYCKRIVGLPGERLRFDGGSAFVNEKKMDTPAVVAGRYYASVYRAHPEFARYQEGQTVVLGEREYFLIGDNVEISKDSRIWGPIDASALVGIADLNYWPLDRFRIFR